MATILEFGNPPIAVHLRRSARARRLSLRVSRLDGRVSLTLPNRVAEREGRAFLSEREAWLRRALADVSPRVSVALGAQMPLDGALLTLVKGTGRRIEVSGAELRVPGPDDRVGAKVKAWLKVLARERLTAASDVHTATLGVGYDRITLRDPRSRWGSCTSDKGLMYSWRLVMAPQEVLNYVAAHEVAHLVHMDHSERFWSVVAGLCPDYGHHRAWLRGEGAGLLAYDFGD